MIDVCSCKQEVEAGRARMQGHPWSYKECDTLLTRSLSQGGGGRVTNSPIYSSLKTIHN